jgi:hypothetical protein
VPILLFPTVATAMQLLILIYLMMFTGGGLTVEARNFFSSSNAEIALTQLIEARGLYVNFRQSMTRCGVVEPHDPTTPPEGFGF